MMLDEDVSETEKYTSGSGEWTSANNALRSLTKVVGHEKLARFYLIDELACGNLLATAEALREEWDIGLIREKPARAGRYVITEQAGSKLGSILLGPDHFKGTPRGRNRRAFDWKNSRFAKIGPPGVTILRKTGEYSHVARKRVVMIGVKFHRKQLEQILKNYQNHKERLVVARSTGNKKSRLVEEDWKRAESKFQDLARIGELRSSQAIYGHGSTNEFAKRLMILCNEDRSNTSRLRTFQRRAKYLLDLDEASGGDVSRPIAPGAEPK